MSKCVNKECGEQLVEGAKFCIICGTAAPYEKEEKNSNAENKDQDVKEVDLVKSAEDNYCPSPSCNAVLRKDAAYCVACGLRIDKKTNKNADKEIETSDKQNESNKNTIIYKPKSKKKKTDTDSKKMTSNQDNKEDREVDALNSGVNKDSKHNSDIAEINEIIAKPDSPVKEETDQQDQKNLGPEVAEKEEADQVVAEEIRPEKAEEQKDEKGEKDDKDEKVIEKIVSDSPSNVEETENEEKKEDQWIIIAGEEPAKKANELDILTLGSGVVSKVAFNKSFSKNSVSVKGKVKCHGCNKMSIFSLESSRGWGGTKEPLTCPCGRSVEIGEYWSDIDNAIYVWASVNSPKEDLEASPLSITITRII
jgi:hypothetical protein